MTRSNIIEIYDDLIGSLGSYKVRGKQVKFDCPKCDEGNKKNLECNYDKKVFKCWSCGFSGSVSKLFKIYSPLSLSKYRSYFSFGDENNVTTKKVEVDRFKFFPKNHLPFFRFKEVKDYLVNERGIEFKELSKRKVRYVYDKSEKYYNNIYFPFYENGSLVSASIYNLTTRKYRNLSPLDFVPYKELIDLNYPITLTEGVIDTMSSINAIPMLGTTVNKAILEFIRGRKTIVALDKSVKLKHRIELYKLLDEYDVTYAEDFNLDCYEDMNEYYLKNRTGFINEYQNLITKLLAC